MANEDEADAGWNGWTTSKHGKVEWSRLIGMPEREGQRSTGSMDTGRGEGTVSS